MVVGFGRLDPTQRRRAAQVVVEAADVVPGGPAAGEVRRRDRRRLRTSRRHSVAGLVSARSSRDGSVKIRKSFRRLRPDFVNYRLSGSFNFDFNSKVLFSKSLSRFFAWNYFLPRHILI